MGLDVYLKHSNLGFERAKAYDELFHELEEKAYGHANKELGEESTWEKIQPIKQQYIKEHIGALNAQFGEESNEDLGFETIEIDSNLFPEHMFKIGYFRSSYNSGGINSVLSSRGLSDLYDIVFGPGADSGNSFYVQPDWEGMLSRVNEAIRTLESYMTSDYAKYRVIEVSAYNDGAALSDAELIADVIGKYQQLKNGSGFARFSCKEGTFFLDGLTDMEVVAVCPQPSRFKMFGREMDIKLVCRSTNDKPMLNEFYIQALQIVKETVEYVLEQPDPQNYCFAWSS